MDLTMIVGENPKWIDIQLVQYVELMKKKYEGEGRSSQKII